MPELPEVEITRKKLVLGGLVGKKVKQIWLDHKPIFKSSLSFDGVKNDIKNRKIISIERRGKVLFLNFGRKRERVLAIHLRMSGSLILSEKNLNDNHIHFKAVLYGKKTLYFHDPRKFGIIWYIKAGETKKYPYLDKLGEDFLKVSSSNFVKKIRKYRGAIKPVLLRQDIFSGIGNIIADEALWESKIHPKTSAFKIKNNELRILYRNILKVIKRSLKSGGSSMRDWQHPDNEKGGYQNRFRVYQRTRCSRCNKKLLHLVVGGRSSRVCPRCQKKK